jgi:signal transduction histidine kinase
MPDKAVDVLNRIQTNGKHLLGLINDVLDISKIEAGQLNLALDDYSMKTLIQSVIASTGSLAQNKGLAVTSEVADDLPPAHGDERRLTQVLLNIVGNAIKFTDKGSIDIRVAEKDGMFDISIRDTGPGIAPEDQARIFEEFQQVDNSSTRQKGGTGLGLAIARRLVRMHGGDITLESAVGKGSTFHVTLPVRAEPPVQQP